jgi:Icc-related predicted phosphoesterase
MLVSDVHCQYGLIDKQIIHAEALFKKEIAQVIVLGDLGYFEHELNVFFKHNPHGFLRPVAFIDGNHEDFAALHDQATRFSPVLTYLPRASLHRFANFSMLAFGGAAYMDAGVTPLGSEITEEQINNCLKLPKDGVDVVISHDCPQGIGLRNHPGFEHYGPPGFQRGLEIVEHLQPGLWFFGHHHRWFDRQCGSTRFIGIAEIWKGYALLMDNAEVIIQQNELSRRLSWWQRFWFGRS